MNEKISDILKDGKVDQEEMPGYSELTRRRNSYDLWKEDFISVGKMRGIGWAVCYQNPANGFLSNHWISLHEMGNISGFVPVLVMDVWEHAYLLDYTPADRPKYIEAFFSNIDWSVCNSRLIGESGSRNFRRVG